MLRYSGLPDCETPNDSGEYYPDILQLEVPTLSSEMELVSVNSRYVERFDLLVKDRLGSAEDDWVILWNNDFACTFDLFDGVVLLFGK